MLQAGLRRGPMFVSLTAKYNHHPPLSRGCPSSWAGSRPSLGVPDQDLLSLLCSGSLLCSCTAQNRGIDPRSLTVSHVVHGTVDGDRALALLACSS
jgi:hypothetical protein